MPSSCRQAAFSSRSSRAWILALLLAPPAGTGEAASLDPSLPFSRYHTRTWTSSDGLPQNTVWAVVPTPDGYLWLATQDGLVRFDGVRFSVFDPSNTPAFTNADITALVADRRGRLWIGTNGGGLLSYDGGSFRRYTVKDGLPDDTVTRLAAGPDGTLWVGTAGHGIARSAGERFTSVPTGDALEGDDVTALAAAEAGGLWIGTRRGLMFLAAGGLARHPLRDAGTSDDVRELTLGGDGVLWIGTTRGLARWHGGRLAAYHPEALGRDFVTAILPDRAGTLWVATRGGGLVRISGGTVSRMRAADGLSEDDVVALYEDRHGTLWVGSNTGGLTRLSVPALTVHGKREGLSHDVALPIVADRSGAMWVGTYGGGLNRFSNGRWTAYTMKQGLAGDQILALWPSQDGSVWVGSRGGLDRIAGGRVESYSARAGLDGAPVVSLYETRSRDLWVGTPTGLIHLPAAAAGASARKFTVQDGLPSNFINVMHEDRAGTLWVGTNGGGLSRRDGNRFVAIRRSDGFPDDIVWAIHEDSSGALWFGTNGNGLVRWKDRRFTTYSTRSGLFNNVVFQILEDRAGNLWMTSPRGISRVRMRDIEAFDARRVETLTAIVYGEADGMRSTDCNGAVQPAGWRSPDGTLWFPTIKGVVVVDPVRAVSAAAPTVLLEDVALDGILQDPRGRATAAPGTRDIQFRYTVLDSAVPARVRFRYRLDGYDRGWVYAGSARTARYMNLSHGSYRFQVQAALEPDEWSPAPAAFALVVKPHFYDTWWFYALCAGGLLVVAATFYAVRVNALHSRHQEIVTLAEARARALEENHRLLQQADKERRRFETLLAAVPGIVWESYDRPDSAAGRIPFVNAHVETMLGYTPDEWFAAPDGWLTIVHPEDRERAEREAAEIVAAGAGEQRFRWVRKDGRVIQVETRCVVIRDAAGTPIGVRGVSMDISERNQLENQLRQAQKMEAVGRLAGGVAHDFNNLLTAIIGNSELLADDVDMSSGPVADAIGEIRSAADRAAALTRQLLAFSRRQVLEPTILDLGDLVARTSGLLRRLIGEDIELSTRMGQGVWQVRADRGQIEQVVMNLAVNARDAMPSGGKLTIEIDRVVLDTPFASQQGEVPPGRYVVLAVSDTGYGMDAETRAHIFEPFFTTKEVGKGTGLGLATVYGIVEQSGGHIWLESAPGLGTTFKIFLPQVDGTPDPVAAERQRPSVPGGTETVMLVEDEPGVRALARKILSRAGYRVLEAANGDEALGFAAQYSGSIDLILTDCVMPGPSGPMLADRLVAMQPSAKILFMSGYSDHAALAHGLLRAGGTFIQKPFTPDALALAVRRALDTGEQHGGASGDAGPAAGRKGLDEVRAQGSA